MSSLYGLLVSSDVLKRIPTAVAGWFVLVLILAFCIGFKKGFRKVAWGGFYWLFASVAFFFAYKFLADKNPLSGTLTGKTAGAASFVWAAILLIGCIAVSLIFYGIFSLMFRPREVEMDPEEEVDEYGFVHEDDSEEEGNFKKAPIIYIKGGAKPSIMARIAGGFMTTVNVAAVLMVVTFVFLLVVSQTEWGTGKLAVIFEVAITQKALNLATTYALDLFTVGVIMAIAYRGYTKGFIGSLCAIVTTIGIILIGDLALAVPFLDSSSVPFVDKLIDRCTSLYTRFKPEVRVLFAKLTAGLILSVIGGIIMYFINSLLKKLIDGIESHEATLILDEVVAVAVYLVIGVLVAVAVWAVFYLLDYCGIIHIGDLFNENSFLSKELFDVAECYLKEFADKYLLKFRAA